MARIFFSQRSWQSHTPAEVRCYVLRSADQRFVPHVYWREGANYYREGSIWGNWPSSSKQLKFRNLGFYDCPMSAWPSESTSMALIKTKGFIKNIVKKQYFWTGRMLFQPPTCLIYAITFCISCFVVTMLSYDTFPDSIDKTCNLGSLQFHFFHFDENYEFY